MYHSIPDFPSDITLKERSNTTIIKVISGSVTPKQLEQEFTNILGANVWMWTARKIDETSYKMRFPNAQLIKSWGHFNLIMKTTPAQISISPWTPAVGAKGELQTAWFRVKGVPYDKRNPKTVAYVGSLFGATVEVDDKSLTRTDYVRIKIACRDITKVPPTAEGAIILYLYDFAFEREVEIQIKPLVESVQILAPANPQPKKPRLEFKGTEKGSKPVGGSTPPKMGGAKQR